MFGVSPCLELRQEPKLTTKSDGTVSLCMFLFGLVTMLQGFVQNYAGLLVTRFFLGVFESGMFPGCKYKS